MHLIHHTVAGVLLILQVPRLSIFSAIRITARHFCAQDSAGMSVQKFVVWFEGYVVLRQGLSTQSSSTGLVSHSHEF